MITSGNARPPTVAQRSEPPSGTLTELVDALEQRLRPPFAGHPDVPSPLLPEPIDAEWVVQAASARIGSLPLLARSSTRSRRSSRRDRGAFATPLPLAHRMVESLAANLEPDRCVILDPACGAGQLLVAAARHLLAQHPRLSVVEQIALVSARIRGVELDAVLARAARLALRLLWADVDADTTPLNQCIVTHDALALQRSDFVDPEQQLLVLANPPFVGVTENGFHAPTVHQDAFRVLATANQAAHFWDRIDDWCSRPGDRYVVLLPRNLLVSEATAGLRRSVDTDLKEVLLVQSSRLFDDATVAVVILTVARPCSPDVVRDEITVLELSGNELAPEPHRRPVATAFDWWSTIMSLDHGLVATTDTGDFDVRAGLVTSDAYLLKPWVQELAADATDVCYCLLTSGLIDPGLSRWGRASCRFLGGLWQRPVVCPPEVPAAWLQRVLDRSRRPKIVVAGLGRRFECLLDPEGIYVPSVGTWVVYHATDDVNALRRLDEFWRASDVEAWMQAELGANAMNGGSITLTRPFMKRLVATALANALSNSVRTTADPRRVEAPLGPVRTPATG